MLRTESSQWNEIDGHALSTLLGSSKARRLFNTSMKPGFLAFFLILIGSTQAWALTAPFAPIPGAATAKMLADCPPAPPPLTALPTQSRYRPDDPTKSEIDPNLAKAYDAMVQPMRDFQGQIVSWANSYHGRPERKKGDAACALSWMNAWATKDALVSLPDGEGQFNRDQAFAGLGLAYLQVSAVEVEGLDAGPAIVAWLREAAEQAIVHYETKAGNVSRRNNHRYYAALAVGVAGIAAGDDELFDWAMETLTSAVCSAGGGRFAAARDGARLASAGVPDLRDRPAGHARRARCRERDRNLRGVRRRAAADRDLHPEVDRRSQAHRGARRRAAAGDR